MKIYTKTGDKGDTGLLGGARVRKDHPRGEAYGHVDEPTRSWVSPGLRGLGALDALAQALQGSLCHRVHLGHAPGQQGRSPAAQGSSPG